MLTAHGANTVHMIFDLVTKFLLANSYQNCHDADGQMKLSCDIYSTVDKWTKAILEVFQPNSARF